MIRPTLLAVVVLLALAPGAHAQDVALASFEHEPGRVRVGETITFRSTSSGNVTNYTWDFGEAGLKYGPEVQHVFASAGEHFVSLTVTSPSGISNTFGDNIAVSDPVAEGLAAYLPDWLFWAMPLLVGSILITLGYVVLQRGQPVIYNLVFFLVYVVSGLKSLTESFAYLTQQTSMHGWFIEANESLAYVFAPLFLWFVLVFPRPIHPWLVEGRRGAIALVLAVPFLLNQAVGWMPFESVLNYFNTYVSLIAMACLGLLVYHAWETDSYEERARIRYLAVTFGILVVTGIVIALLNLAYTYQLAVGDDAAATSLRRATAIFGLIIGPLLEIGGAILMMYAILRFQLMGIQSLVVKVTRSAVMALTVPAIFIIVGNVIEEIFQNVVLEGQNIRFDFIIAGFVSAFAMAPVQKFTTFALNKLLPALTAAEEADRRVQIYETQLRYSLLDGALNERELNVLRQLAREIQLRPEELERVTKTFPAADLRGLAAPAVAAA